MLAAASKISSLAGPGSQDAGFLREQLVLAFWEGPLFHYTRQIIKTLLNQLMLPICIHGTESQASTTRALKAFTSIQGKTMLSHSLMCNVARFHCRMLQVILLLLVHCLKRTNIFLSPSSKASSSCICPSRFVATHQSASTKRPSAKATG